MKVEEKRTQNERIREVFYGQLAKDFACSAEELRSPENVFVPKKLIPGRRLFFSDAYLFQAVSLRGKAVFTAEEGVLGELREAAKDLPAEWLSMNGSLEILSGIANRHGYRLNGQHHYYLPLGNGFCPPEGPRAPEGAELRWYEKGEFEPFRLGNGFCPPEGAEIRWYEKGEFEPFRGDPRFTHALGFLPSAPDILGVTASFEGEIAGFAAASEDSPEMWQIGIDVVPAYRGRNIGPFLTALLKDEILKRGAVPYYGTAESHLQSQAVALKAGFFPVWWEVHTEKLP